MIYYNQQDKILANIARVIEKRLKDKSTDLTLVLDPTLKELERITNARVEKFFF